MRRPKRPTASRNRTRRRRTTRRGIGRQRLIHDSRFSGSRAPCAIFRGRTRSVRYRSSRVAADPLATRSQGSARDPRPIGASAGRPVRRNRSSDPGPPQVAAIRAAIAAASVVPSSISFRAQPQTVRKSSSSSARSSGDRNTLREAERGAIGLSPPLGTSRTSIRHVEVLDHAPHDERLLIIIAAKIRAVGLHEVEQLEHDGGHTAEVPWPKRTLRPARPRTGDVDIR